MYYRYQPITFRFPVGGTNLMRENITLDSLYTSLTVNMNSRPFSGFLSDTEQQQLSAWSLY